MPEEAPIVFQLQQMLEGSYLDLQTIEGGTTVSVLANKIKTPNI